MKDGCPFCDFDGVVIRDHKSVLIVRPLNPVVPGHVLAIPKQHVVDALADPVIAAMTMAAAADYARGSVGPCNIITSVGPEATQTVFHLHLHVVPRRKDDGLHLPWTGQETAEHLEQGDGSRWEPVEDSHEPAGPMRWRDGT
jgi:histidine triad (HIT) family protein